jgi:hypothetical protein
VIAVIDEVAPEIGGTIYYTVASATLLADDTMTKSALTAVLADGRRRPVHWPDEGPHCRERMLECIATVGVLARAVVVPCGRRSQEAARRAALRPIVEDLVADGCERLVIESRSEAQDGRDRAQILDTLRGLPGSPVLAYEWRGKDEPSLWIADTICGVVREHLERTTDLWYERVCASTGLVLSYRALGK